MAQKEEKKWYRVLIQYDQPRKKFKCKKTNVHITLNLKIEEEYQKKKGYLPKLKSSVNNCFTRCTLRVEWVMGALHYLICVRHCSHIITESKQNNLSPVPFVIASAAHHSWNERKIKSKKFNALAQSHDRSLKNFTNFILYLFVFFFFLFSSIRSFASCYQFN